MKSFSYFFIQLTLGILMVSETLLAQSPMASDYKVKPEDLLSIEVFREPDLTVPAVRVEASGTITMYLLDEIPVAGRTVREIQDDIAKRLKDGYIKNPQVKVQVEFTDQFFTIIGEVVIDGMYELPNEKRMDLTEAIAKANGFTPNAKKSRIELWRSGEKKTYDFDELLQIKEDENKIFIRPGDKIVVPARFF
ncbi:MAG: polysaccharide biosynthesis/export family protein [Verrucomicrobiota bacterium]|jgi:polysaccharide export outer membrane protein